MAVTKLLRIKETHGSNKALHLKNNIFYICREDKTAGGLWIGGNAGSTPEIIYRTFMENKRHWGKEDGSQGFHYMLSFPPDCGIDEATAFQVAEEFCRELLGDDYYYAFAVHNDKAHMHVHITFDSVSKTDGLKFHSPKGDWKKRIQPITDRLCEKYHLPTLEYDEDRRGRNYGEWKRSKQMEKREYYSWTDIIRDDIDEAIQHSDSYEAFLNYLRSDGYTVTRNGKFLSLRPEGAGRAFRTGRLGDGYAKEEIIQRIADKGIKPEIEIRYKTYGDRIEMRRIILAKIERTPGWRMTPFVRQFWKRWNNTYFIRKPGRMTLEERQQIKKDILDVQKLSRAISYMVDYDIGDLTDLQKRCAQLESECDALKHELSVSRTRLYKKQPFYLVSRCEKMKKELSSDPSPALMSEIAKTEKKIEETCPYDEALKKWDKAKADMEISRKVLNDCRAELGVVQDIFQLFYQMDAPQNDLSEEKKTNMEKERRMKTDGRKTDGRGKRAERR